MPKYRVTAIKETKIQYTTITKDRLEAETNAIQNYIRKYGVAPDRVLLMAIPPTSPTRKK